VSSRAGLNEAATRKTLPLLAIKSHHLMIIKAVSFLNLK
jgi:hypothetical protein